MNDKENTIRRAYEKKFQKGKHPVEKDDVQLLTILKYLPTDLSCRILDAGCGEGRYARALSERGYHNLCGIDLITPESPHTCMTYRQGSFENTGYDDHSFDFIYCNSGIFYLSEPQQGIREFHRILKPGGNCILTGHTRWSLFTLVRRIKMKLGFSGIWYLKGARFFSTSQYVKWLEQSGFTVRCVDGFGSMPIIAYEVKRRLAILCKKRFGRCPSVLRNRLTRNKTIARLKSDFAYHYILVAEKPKD